MQQSNDFDNGAKLDTSISLVNL